MAYYKIYNNKTCYNKCYYLIPETNTKINNTINKKLVILLIK